MFIVWGTKAVTRRLGWAADFCPICREVEPFQVAGIRKVGHLYGIPLGSGELLGHQRTCGACGVVLKADTSLYRELSKKAPGPDLAALVAATFPGVRERHAERLALEDQLARRPGPVDPTTRATLLREPFLLLAPSVERRFAQTNLDLRATASFGAGLVAAVTLSVLLRRTALGPLDLGSAAFWLALAAGTAATVRFGLQARRRFLDAKVYPQLARALRPLDPSRQELEATLADLKRQGLKLGRKARLDELLAALKPANRLVA